MFLCILCVKLTMHACTDPLMCLWWYYTDIYWYYEWVISERGGKKAEMRISFCCCDAEATYVVRLKVEWEKNWFYFRTHTISRLLTFNDEVSIIIVHNMYAKKIAVVRIFIHDTFTWCFTDFLKVVELDVEWFLLKPCKSFIYSCSHLELKTRPQKCKQMNLNSVKMLRKKKLLKMFK